MRLLDLFLRKLLGPSCLIASSIQRPQGTLLQLPVPTKHYSGSKCDNPWVISPYTSGTYKIWVSRFNTNSELYFMCIQCLPWDKLKAFVEDILNSLFYMPISFSTKSQSPKMIIKELRWGWMTVEFDIIIL